MKTNSYWADTARAPKFLPLRRDLEVDVAVIGGGITGVTSAYLLTKAGATVALLERDRFGVGETGHTTAHLTCVTDARLHELVKTFGRDHAQAAWMRELPRSTNFRKSSRPKSWLVISIGCRVISTRR